MKISPRATRRHGENHAAPAAECDGASDEGGDQLVISLPHPRVLRVIARSVLLTASMLVFPWLRSMLLPAANADSILSPQHRWADEPFFLPMLLRDLKREGLLIAGTRGSAVFLGNPGARFALVKQNRMFPVMSEIGRMAVPDRSVDFVLATDGFSDASFVFVERVLRIGGVTIIRLSSDPSHILRLPANYRIIYIRKFGSTIVGIKKMAHAITQIKKNASDSMGIWTGRKLFAVPESNKKLSSIQEDANAAEFTVNQIGRKLLAIPKSNKDILNGLEDALLEPPLDSKELTRFKKRMRYLADLLGSSLNEYPRRVFIDVGPPRRRLTSEKWFEEQYPKRDSEFEIVRLVMGKGKHATGASGIARWLAKNVKEEDYVVMKAEAEVAEEMLKEKAAALVDELFLECDNQWDTVAKGSRRAYWECLVLFGRLRDEGVAVHQWWD
ncbi:hypothetical protein Cni_G04933 [Canna indica]|uniref:DUF7870 domain-containing protein n=1 Tax=Canna indica TaxID=4628 RepID=A0AAQ3JUD0_9LILI|nr:hypothetical protein Cni_G04933 [Canna indica]